MSWFLTFHGNLKSCSCPHFHCACSCPKPPPPPSWSTPSTFSQIPCLYPHPLRYIPQTVARVDLTKLQWLAYCKWGPYQLLLLSVLRINLNLALRSTGLGWLWLPSLLSCILFHCPPYSLTFSHVTTFQFIVDIKPFHQHWLFPQPARLFLPSSEWLVHYHSGLSSGVAFQGYHLHGLAQGGRLQ